MANMRTKVMGRGGTKGSGKLAKDPGGRSNPGYPGADPHPAEAEGRTGYQMNVKKSPAPEGTKIDFGGSD